MTKGIVIVAHDNSIVKYSELAIVSAHLAKKHLKLPVSLIIDSESLKNLNGCVEKNLFDKIIIIDKEQQHNPRVMYGKIIDDFLNVSRSKAWKYTPYDHTLLIDSDLLIFSDRFNHYWDLDEDFLICDSMIDPLNKRLGFADKRISDIAPKLKWATAIMFKKNQCSKTLFDLVDHIFENYNFYADTYFFDERQYRNDIAFSIADHILNGFVQSETSLFSVYMTMMDDEILSIDGNKIKFLLKDNTNNSSSIVSFDNTDIHVMNKLDILKNKELLLK